MQKVWFRSFDGWWYATLKEGGVRKQIKLLKAPDTRDGRKLAEGQLVRELGARDYSQAKAADDPAVAPWLTVGHVLRGFLRHSRAEHSPETADWHQRLLEPFVRTWGNARVGRLRKQHVLTWVKAKKYNPTSAAKAIGVLKRAFNWAVEEEHIPRNPVAHVRKPRPQTRDRTLTPDERKLILDSIRDEAFRQFVMALSSTGCRPGEVARVTAADADLVNGLWVLRRHKTQAKTGKPRTVYLCAEALALTRLLAAQPPDGPLFLNSRGRPWTRNAVRIRFRRLRARFPQLKGVVAYTFRSTFATDALEGGVPDTTVSTLLGHTNTATLHRFYARLSHRVGHLKNAAEQATRPRRGVGEPPAGTPA
jgi:integrase